MNASRKIHCGGVAAVVLAVVYFNNVAAQSKEAEKVVVFCDEQRTIALLEKQVAEAKTFDAPGTAIPVMVAAADLLWNYDERKSRSIFTDAFEKSKIEFGKTGDQTRQDGKLLIGISDQRITVLNAISKRDVEWGLRLVKDLAPDSAASEEGKATSESSSRAKSAQRRKLNEKIASLAAGLEATNQEAAIRMMRSSFQYPASMFDLFFFFQLAKSNKTAADQLFKEAISAYATGSVDDLLYLSAYPFGLPLNIGPTTGGYTRYAVPPGFTPDPSLQQFFITTMFQLFSKRIEDRPAEQVKPTSTSVAEQIYTAVSALEPFIAQHFPEYLDGTATLKSQAVTMISDRTRQEAESEGRAAFAGEAPKNSESFEKAVEGAEKNVNVQQRDYTIVQLVIRMGSREPIDSLLKAIEKISDADVRKQLLNWAYFVKTQSLITDNQLNEAVRLAQKVEEVDQRAFLMTQIAEEGVKEFNDRARAIDLLDQAAKTASQAPNTAAKARALMGIAALYSQFDALKAADVMSSAVKAINVLPDADLSYSMIIRRIESKTYAMFTGAPAPGFTLEASFREFGKRDFNGALWVAEKLDDRPRRATAIISLVTECLTRPPGEKKPATAGKPNK